MARSIGCHNGSRGGRTGSGRSSRSYRDSNLASTSITQHDDDERGLDGIQQNGDDVVSSHMVRGPNIGEQIPDHPSLRLVVHLAGGDFADPSVTRKIMSILKSMFNGSWAYWHNVDCDSREQLWERFQALYQWDPRIYESVRNAWLDVMQRRYSDLLSGAREDSVDMARQNNEKYEDVRNIGLIREYPPNWIPREHWRCMVDKVWNTPKWIAKSLAAQRNRNTLHDGVIGKHTGGSISNSQHRYQMEKEYERLVTTVELFERTHLKRGWSSSLGDETSSQEFITPKAVNKMESYKSSMSQRYGEDITSLPFDRELWEKNSGGAKKGRLYGCGGAKNVDYVLGGSHGSSSTCNSASGSAFLSPYEVHELLDNQKKEME